MRKPNLQLMQDIQEYIAKYQEENNASPSYRNIMHAMGMSSLNLVQLYVLRLEKEKRIQRTRLGKIELPEELDLRERVVVPLVGNIACGQPNFAEQNIECNYALPVGIFGRGDLFLLRAFGESMIEAVIKEGDLLVIKKQNTAEDGEIVVALIEGEATLKRFYKKGKKIILHPENKTMQDIVLSNCEIQGVLVSCIKLFG